MTEANMADNYLTKTVYLASADGHVGCPTVRYRDYLEKRLHPAFDDYLAAHRWRWTPLSKDSLFPSNFNDKFLGTEGFDPSVGSPVAWDPSLRLRALDQGGIVCEVLHPDDQNSNDPPFGSGLANAPVAGSSGTEGYPPDLVRAGARAYNRWVADFCSADDRRLLGLIVLGTLDDVNWCVEEIDRAYQSGLRTGVLLPLEYYLPLYHHPRYDMLWDACAERNLTVDIHVSKGHPSYLGDDPRTERFMYAFESTWYAQRPLWSLIFGGVLERWPDLRLTFTEMGVDWVAPLLERLDIRGHRFDGAMNAMDGYAPKFQLSLSPSEYWSRQCYVGHSTEQRRDQFEGATYDGVPNMMWGADTAHSEGIWPVASGVPYLEYTSPTVPIEDAVKTLLGGLPAVRILPYLQDNFFRAFPSVERGMLAGVSERLGMSIESLGLVA